MSNLKPDITFVRNYFLLQVNAEASNPNDPVTYSLDGYLVRNEGAKLTVNNNGQVMTGGNMDRDRFPVWQFNVVAKTSNGEPGYGIISVRPTDVNDNAPVFDPCCLEGTIPENNNAGMSDTPCYKRTG